MDHSAKTLALVSSDCVMSALWYNAMHTVQLSKKESCIHFRVNNLSFSGCCFSSGAGKIPSSLGISCLL